MLNSPFDRPVGTQCPKRTATGCQGRRCRSGPPTRPSSSALAVRTPVCNLSPSPLSRDAAHHQGVQDLPLCDLVPLLSQQLHARSVPSDRRRIAVSLVIHLPEGHHRRKKRGGEGKKRRLYGRYNTKTPSDVEEQTNAAIRANQQYSPPVDAFRFVGDCTLGLACL